VLQSGDNVLFPSGPAGRPGVQPDSGKIMIRWSPEPDDSRWFRLASAADYCEGEAEPD
jgi:hypothetical protein